MQIDFTELRLSLKLGPTGGLLRSFVELNNQVLQSFTLEERRRIGVHVCPGGDHHSTHSADIDFADLLPELFRLNVGRFYLQMASEPNRKRFLATVKQVLGPHQLVFIGVIDPISSEIEIAEQVRDRILEAASILPLDSSEPLTTVASAFCGRYLVGLRDYLQQNSLQVEGNWQLVRWGSSDH